MVYSIGGMEPHGKKLEGLMHPLIGIEAIIMEDELIIGMA